uniref:sensor histidine kinase n=1 Tax=Thaumasiovibrio occultus TaxID=1891184 RepID=UPI000B357110|nr:histidine kinase [Thaumasiovibrio occultus]
MQTDRIEFDWLRSIGFTTTFCLAISLLTMSLWSGNIWLHLAISFGFGYSAMIGRFLRFVRPDLSYFKLGFFSVFVSMAVGSANAYYWLHKAQNSESLEMIRPVLLLSLIFTCVCYYHFYAHSHKLLSDRALESAQRRQSEQDKALLLSQIQQLQSQIEPHFLFNTLANIRVLVDSDTEKAKLVLEKLTDLLRVTLKKSREMWVSLEEEITLITSYLAIQKVRLGDRLDYTINVNVDSRKFDVPSILIQPLVENAVLHGIEPKLDGGRIDISIYQEETSLVFLISDTGVGLNAPSFHKGSGVGLTNIKDRLCFLFHDQASLTIKENGECGVIAKIMLPMQDIQGELIDASNYRG